MDSKAVEQVQSDHAGLITNGRQVIGFVPLLQKRQIVEEGRKLIVGDLDTKGLCARAELLFRCTHCRIIQEEEKAASLSQVSDQSDSAMINPDE